MGGARARLTPYLVAAVKRSREAVLCPLRHFGGSVHTAPSTFDLVFEALRAGEFNPLALIRLLEGGASSGRNLWPEMSCTDLSRSALSFSVPVFFLLGRHDRVAPCGLAAAYRERLSAPLKKLVRFEHSAHNPNFEEPERFNRTILEEVLPRI